MKFIFYNNILDNNYFMWGLNHTIILVKSLIRTYLIFYFNMPYHVYSNMRERWVIVKYKVIITLNKSNILIFFFKRANFINVNMLVQSVCFQFIL